MQYQICQLMLRMIEQEYCSAIVVVKHTEIRSATIQDLQDYAKCYRGTSNYRDKLASAYYLLNQLQAHY